MSNHGKIKRNGPGSSGRKKARARAKFERHMAEIEGREPRAIGKEAKGERWTWQ